MNFEFRMPNMKSMQPEQAVAEMQRYLFEMKRALDLTLEQVDRSIESTNQSAARLEKKTEQITNPKSTFTAIKDLIIKSADIIEKTSASVERQLAGKYLAVSDFGTFRQETENRMEATDTAIIQSYSSIQEIESLVAGINDQQIEMNAYIRTGMLYEDASGVPRYGVEIGEQAEKDGALGFRKFARLASDRLTFYDQNENEVAYISDRKLHITEADIKLLNGETLIVKRLELDPYLFWLQDDGHLTIL